MPVDSFFVTSVDEVTLVLHCIGAPKFDIAPVRLWIWLQIRVLFLNNCRQVIHPFVPLLPSSMIWYQFKNWEGNDML